MGVVFGIICILIGLVVLIALNSDEFKDLK